MRKKDPIFWGAASIFVLAIVLFGVTQNQLWLALLVGSYLLRPTLASLGIARKLVDERQMTIQYRSGNIGFAVMIVACIVLAGVIPGLAIVGMGWLAKKFPRSIGGTIFAITAVLLYVILARGFTIGQITTALVVSVPLAAAGLCLIVGDRKDSDADDGPAAEFRSRPG